jgi:hypothetical protein
MPKMGVSIWTFVRDASSHFRHRVTDWGAVATLINFSAFIARHPELFSRSGFSGMSHIADNDTWAVLGIGVSLAHFTALIINGSIPSITWTPIVRAVCSALSALFWFQLAWGSLFYAGSETVFAPILVALCLYNTVNATTETRGD